MSEEAGAWVGPATCLSPIVEHSTDRDSALGSSQANSTEAATRERWVDLTALLYFVIPI